MNHGFNGWVSAAPGTELYGAVAPGVCDDFGVCDNFGGVGDSFVGSGIGLDIARSTGMAPALPIGAAPKAGLAGLKLCVTAALIEAGVTPGTGSLEVGIHELAGVTSINLQ
jgi:hypothetical protein